MMGKYNQGLTEEEQQERESLRARQRNSKRWFTQKEFDRLKELDEKKFKSMGSPHAKC